KRVRDDLAALFQTACALEDQALLGLYGQGPLDEPRLEEERASSRRRWTDVLLALYLLPFDQPDDVTVAVFSEQSDVLFELTHAYYTLAGQQGGRAELWQFLPPRAGREDDPMPERRLVLQPEQALTGTAAVRVRPWDHDLRTYRDEVPASPRKSVIGLG